MQGQGHRIRPIAAPAAVPVGMSESRLIRTFRPPLQPTVREGTPLGGPRPERAAMAAPRYRALIRLQGAPTLLIVGVIARLGIGMTPLALLLLVQQRTGRYAIGGVAVGAYAVAGAIAN